MARKRELSTFFIIEVMVALFTVGTVEKAVQLGARLAVVSDAESKSAIDNGTLTAPYAVAMAGFFSITWISSI